MKESGCEKMRLFLWGMLIFLLGGCLLAVGGCAKKAVEAEPSAHTNDTEMRVRAESVSTVREQTQSAKRVKFIFDGGEATAELHDNSTSRDFQSLLPMTLQFKDFNNTEKIAYPPRALAIEKTPPKFEPSVGELTVFVPWGNLAVFYRDFKYSDDLVSIGRVTSGIESLAKMEGAFSARIEAISE